MKFIDERSLQEDAREYLDILIEKGIFAVHSSEYNSGPHSYAGRKGVWVMLNHQYKDAIKLKCNIDHVVSAPLSEEEMDELKKKAYSAFYSSSEIFFSTIAKTIFYIAIISFSVYFAYDMYQYT